MNNSIIENILKRAKLRVNIDDKPTPIHIVRGTECVAIYENVLVGEVTDMCRIQVDLCVYSCYYIINI